MIHKVSIAPMVDVSTTHFRRYIRLITESSLLYTEMIPASGILKGDRKKLLYFSKEEKPISLQIAGENPQELALCAEIAEDEGYDEVNLNAGCPSEKIQCGNYGAVLMKYPDQVAEIVSAMKSKVKIPVTVKHRIGVDDFEGENYLLNFIDKLHQAGCDQFIIHGRKALLKGLSPKENRIIPPLMPELVRNIKKNRPSYVMIFNGEIKDIKTIKDYLVDFEGVMIGRASYEDSYMLSEVDSNIYQSSSLPPSRREILNKLKEYSMTVNAPAHHVLRNTLGLFTGLPGARKYRQIMGDERNCAAAAINRVLNLIPDDVLDQRGSNLC